MLAAHASYTRVQLTTAPCKVYHGGQLTICLAPSGCANQPVYHIVAAHKCSRDGCFLEELGSYDPLACSQGEKIIALNLDQIQYWIGFGTHLSKSVE